MSIVLGLTGSIGMGKSTTAQMFAEAGCAVWDADDAVRRLYGPGGAAVPLMHAAFPGVVSDGTVSRQALRDLIAADATALARIEAIVHPLVAADRIRFLETAEAEIVVLDIPLLFETGANALTDAVVCVSVSEQEQERRVLQRGTMSRAQFVQIRDKQMPNSEKCNRADFVIETDTLEHARSQVQDVIATMKGRFRDA